MEIQRELKQDIIERRRDRARNAFGNIEDIILIGAGKPIPIPGGADQTFPFRPHPEYTWLTGRAREGGVLAFDPNDGWTLFEPTLTELEQVWGGGPHPVGRSLTELDEWLKAREGCGIKWLGVAKDAVSDKELSERLLHARRPKDEAELEFMRAAVHATAAGHAAAVQYIRPGVTERQVQIELEAAFYRNGADGVGYGTIVGSGPNSTQLHSEPGTRRMQDGDIIVLDAGGEVNGYTADVTRTLAASGKFNADQQAIYDAVLRAQLLAIDACKVGAEWGDVHLLAARSMAESLHHMGVIRVGAEEAVENGIITMFFPHGIGHMVGLGVRDASGPYPGRAGDRKFAGIKLRMDLILDEGYIVTVEPGLYFNNALLRNEKRREKFKDVVDWAMIEPWIGNLGVRIEDNILVTKNGPVNLTSEIPK